VKRYRAIPDYYDAEYEHHDMLQHDVPFLLSQLPRRRQSILELAVGTARAAIPLAQAGHRVVGIDCDRRMLALARRKRDSVGLCESRLSLRCADALTFRAQERFDWVVLLFNTFLNFTTLRQQDRLLANVRRHLAPGGRFWLDVFQPDLLMLARHRSTNAEPHLFYVPAMDRTVFRSTDIVRDPARQVQHVSFNYLWFDRAGRPHRQRTRFDLTFVFPRELRLLLERHGLSVLRMWGNYDGQPLGADSPRMIVLSGVAPATTGRAWDRCSTAARPGAKGPR
jgi:SAM-dependent methyltransferase